MCPFGFQELFLGLFNCRSEAELNKYLLEHPHVFRESSWVDCSIKMFDSHNYFESKLYPILAIIDYLNSHNIENLDFESKDLQLLADGDLETPTLTIYCAWGHKLSVLSNLKDTLETKDALSQIKPILYSGQVGYCLVAEKSLERINYTLVKRNGDFTEGDVSISIFAPNHQLAYFETRDSLNLQLHERLFSSGSISRFFSYNLPPSSRSVISRDLRATLDEIMFSSPKPFLIVDRKYRFPKDIHLEREVYGRKATLEKPNNRYVHKCITESYNDLSIGKLDIAIYLFRYFIDSFNYDRSLSILKREVFKHKMKVVLTTGGIVRYHFKKDFLTALGYDDLKEHVLIHIDGDGLHQSITNIFERGNAEIENILLKIKKALEDILEKHRVELIFYGAKIKELKFN